MPIVDAALSYDIANQPPATPEGVAAFLGRPGDPDVLSLAGEHLPLVASFVRAYTRGNGFTGQQATDELCAVIVTATARLVNNPTGDTLQTAGPFTVRPGVFNGFTLLEQLVLNRYRTRAA